MKNNFMISIGVNNLDKSIDFYNSLLGFRLLKRIEIEQDIEFAFMIYNESIEFQLIHRKTENKPKNDNSMVVLSFKTSDILKDQSTLLKSKFNIKAEIFELKSGIKTLSFNDFDGTKLSFIQEQM